MLRVSSDSVPRASGRHHHDGNDGPLRATDVVGSPSGPAAVGLTLPRRPLLLSSLLTLGGCVGTGTTSFPVSEEDQRALPPNVRVVRLDATNIQPYIPREQPPVRSTLPVNGRWDYRVGVNDIINVIVFDHPELTLPAGPQRSAEESGQRVQSDGTFFFPFVGQVMALGRTPEQIREDIRHRLSAFIQDPQVEVRIAAFNSQSVLVTGEVKRPARLPLTTVPLSLMEAITAADGVTEHADLRHVTVRREGTLHTVDLQAFLRGGLGQNNPMMLHRDLIHVPRFLSQRAFLLGEVMRPDVIDLAREPVMLTEAITRQGGLQMQRADARGIFVFRETPPDTTVLQLETTSPTGWILGTRFALAPGDVIYIVRSPAQSWNDIIAQIMPTVSAARLALSPPSIAISQ